MAKHTELVSVSSDDGEMRFCLDSVIRDDEDGREEFALVWRGTKTSKDGFNFCPAYFTGELIGELVGKALRVKNVRIKPFIKALVDSLLEV